MRADMILRSLAPSHTLARWASPSLPTITQPCDAEVWVSGLLRALARRVTAVLDLGQTPLHMYVGSLQVSHLHSTTTLPPPS